MRRVAMVWFVVIACAWVLWEERPEKIVADVLEPARRWSTLGAWQTKQECEATIDAAVAAARRQGEKLVGRAVCLPDTVDPRPPAPKRER